ncbi:MAG: lysoplasmalogenase [Anaerolineae bacterium]|nr:lysoplasmalogenase [Anaerolineae bacterium]
MTAGGLALFAFGFALLDWYAVWKDKSRWRWLTKPMPMMLLIILVGVLRPGYPFPVNIFCLGLLLGLVGDVLLLFNGEKFFLLGLAAFLGGHLLYILGFNIEPVGESFGMVICLVPIAVGLAFVLRRLVPFVNRKLRVAVWAYVLIILTMWYSAMLTAFRSEWETTAVILAICGATLFVMSDTMLAIGKFIKPVSGLWVMVTYHLAQMAIAAAVLYQY